MTYSYYVYDLNGDRNWYSYAGNMHREDGPAYESEIDGVQSWMLHNQLHRYRMPAVIWRDGYVEYHEHGVFKGS